MVPAISNIYIYAEPRCSVLDFQEVALYVQEKLPAIKVKLRGPILESFLDNDKTGTGYEKIACALAMAKVRNLEKPVLHTQRVLPGEISYEIRRLKNRESSVYGILYDAGLLSDIYRDLLPVEESSAGHLHIIFTNQLIGTWDTADRRYHARTVICGAPSIVSVSGMVEAPAKKPGYYIARQSAEAWGLQAEAKMELSMSFAGDCLKMEDPRLTEAAKGYVMQAVVYRLTGEPFCNDPDCRLFNAHRQSELIRAQFGGPYEFCQNHREILAQCQFRSGVVSS